MSNFLAVATVTAALRNILQPPVAGDVPGASVGTERPEIRHTNATVPGVNIYLYEVAPNPALRNVDLPTRRSDGAVTDRPQAALDLHYLLTFYGSDRDLEPERLLGSVVRTLHARPVVTAQVINAIRTAATGSPPTNAFLATTDLGDQIERVKFSPLSLSLEDLSKLWSVFFQTPYALSVAYQASVVLIEETVTPVPAPPVAERGLVVSPLVQPVLDAVVAASGRSDPIFANSTVVLVGRGLQGDVTLVRIAGADLAPAHAAPAEVRFDLSSAPAGTLRPGHQMVQVVHRVALGHPPTPHMGAESNVVTFLLHPTVTSVAAAGTAGSGTVTVGVDLTVGAAQEVALALLDPVTGVRRRIFAAPARTADGTSVSVPISGLAAGTHAVQLLVEGASSQLVRSGGVIVSPIVTLA